MRCVILVSVGRNPVTGRPRLPPDEAAAITLAVRAGLAPRLLHAGSPRAAPILRRGLGLGAMALDILDIGERTDPLPALVSHLAGDLPVIVLCGARAETGECSAMIPYRLAAALDLPVIPDCMDLAQRDSAWIARAKKSGGARQLLGLPHRGAVIALASGALRAPLGSRLAADRGAVTVEPVTARPDPRYETETQPARRVPPPIVAPRSASGGGNVLTDAEAGAEAILVLLQKTGLCRASPTKTSLPPAPSPKQRPQMARYV